MFQCAQLSRWLSLSFGFRSRWQFTRYLPNSFMWYVNMMTPYSFSMRRLLIFSDRALLRWWYAGHSVKACAWYHMYHSVQGVPNPLKNSVICPPFRSTGYFEIEFHKKFMVHPWSSAFKFREMVLQRAVTISFEGNDQASEVLRNVRPECLGHSVMSCASVSKMVASEWGNSARPP